MSAVSARKLAANRANAMASTGPRTAAGKARSSRNALRHGLCSESWADPAVTRAIERLGRAIAGNATGEERGLAYRVAAAQVDLERAQEAQRKVFADPRLGALLASGGIGSPPDETDVDATLELLEDSVYELAAIKRYEDRAYGQRRRAILQLDGLRTGERPRARRPPGMQLPRWRMRPLSLRIIRFEGLPRWAWWRPDPLSSEPASRPGGRACQPTPSPRRGEGWGEGPSQESRVSPPSPYPLPHRGHRGEGTQPEPPRQANPPHEQAGSQSRQLPPASMAAATPAPAATAQQSGETNPRRWVVTAIPIPTCRIGPCRWVGEPPARHWSTRGWRYKRRPSPTRSRGPPW
jgi:hypothetical protein